MELCWVLRDGDGSESLASEGIPKITIELSDIKDLGKPEPYNIESEFLKELMNPTKPDIFPLSPSGTTSEATKVSKKMVAVPVSEPWVFGRSGGWSEKDSIPQSDSAEYMEKYFKKHPNSYYKKEY